MIRIFIGSHKCIHVAIIIGSPQLIPGINVQNLQISSTCTLCKARLLDILYREGVGFSVHAFVVTTLGGYSIPHHN